MPLYDYDCATCGTRFEVIHGVHAEGPTSCPSCGGGPVRKAFAAPAVHFKGSGWAKKERRAATSASSSSGSGDSASPSGDTAAATGGSEGGSSSGSATASTDATAPAPSTAGSTTD